MCFLNVPQHGNISSFNGLGVPTSKACSHVGTSENMWTWVPMWEHEFPMCSWVPCRSRMGATLAPHHRLVSWVSYMCIHIRFLQEMCPKTWNFFQVHTNFQTLKFAPAPFNRTSTGPTLTWKMSLDSTLDGCLFWEHPAPLTTTLHNFVEILKQKPNALDFSGSRRVCLEGEQSTARRQRWSQWQNGWHLTIEFNWIEVTPEF